MTWYSYNLKQGVTLHFTADKAEQASRADLERYRTAVGGCWEKYRATLSWGEMVRHGEAVPVGPGVDGREDWSLVRLPVAEGADAACLRRSLAEPVVDGQRHPGELALAHVASDLGSAVDGWCLGLLDSTRSHAELASVIKLLGRAGLPTLVESRSALLKRGLASPSVEVHEAVVRAAGAWGDARWLPVVFLQHRDAVVWLGEYIDQVASDLAERKGR